MNLFSVQGKKILITGASTGLGKAMAEVLHEAGAKIVIVSSSERIFAAAKEIELVPSAGRVFAIQADLGDRESLKSCFGQAVNYLDGGLDVLINSAGIQRRATCETFSQEAWDKVLEVNLSSVFTLCQLAGRQMLKRGNGKIINIASLLSFFGGQNVPAYAASKGGVVQLTKALSNEWAARGVTVNAIAPGYMNTEMNTALVEDQSRNQKILARIPAGRWGTPEDMKGVALFLSSPASDYISGAVIPVDGGYLGA